MRGRTSLRELARHHGVPEKLLRRVARGEGLEDTSAIASYMGVPPATVRRWRGKGKSAGVPPDRLAKLAEFLADREATKRAEAAEKKKVKGIITRARKQGIMPRSAPKGTTRFGGARAVGVRTIYHLNQYLSVGTLQMIEDMTMHAPKGPRYIVTVQAVEAGTTGKVRGYRGKMTQKLGKAGENISFASAITSGQHKNRQKALEILFGKLQDAIDDADALIFITDLLVFSYQYKDDEMKRRKERGLE